MQPMKKGRTHKASKFRKQTNRLQVKDLKPNRPINRLDLIILRIYPRRLIYSESYTGPVAAACGRDETGLVGVVLWDKQIDEVRIGDIIRFESGWCQMRDGELIVSTGINGNMRIIDR
ncbi:MAG: hypothetical protein VX043_03690 [Candidatus Thermoplasmatota archaeon]|nr:hypothetical protein [Candidatus Thermoplasmatota archaeon]MEC8242597.1 hypothetical protein [Candidatus Thermoplasmatota archaeon]MEC8249603.1 hypothetical protein [Candidatus Thermoplasmatota archaeon]MEC8257752.1 hypothetical protein [Candidatus Thermoplasmatota archaeon]